MPRATWHSLAPARRGQLLDAAMAEFGQHGYSTGSLTVIARTAGVTQAALFQYFHDRLDLFAHVAEQAVQRVYAALEDDLREPWGSRDLVDRFCDLVESWIGYMSAHPLERAVTAATVMELDPHVRRVVREPAHRVFAQALRPLLAAAGAEHRVRADADLEALLALLVLLLPHLALAPFEPGLDVAVPLFGVPRATRVANSRRLVTATLSGFVPLAERVA